MQFIKKKIVWDYNDKEYLLDGYCMDFNLYNVHIDFTYGDLLTTKQREVMREYIGLSKQPDNDDDEWGVAIENGSNFLVYVSKIEKTATLIHELYHLVNFISKRAGLSEDKTNEQQAYLLGYLVEEIEKIIKKEKQNKKTKNGKKNKKPRNTKKKRGTSKR